MRGRLAFLLLTAFGANGIAHSSDRIGPSHACKSGADWNEPAAPRRIFGNAWFVGTCGISSVLVTSGQGHFLLDGTTEKAAPLIEANIARLGFRVADVRYIVNSHAHLDHAGGIARLQKDSGATVIARGADASALERGHGDHSDPQFVSAKPFPAVAHVRPVADGETLTIGDTTSTAHATSGHTPGSTSWTWDACEAQHCAHVVYADSLAPVSDDDYRYTDDAAHAGVLADFRTSIARVAALPCDLLLTPHPDASHMWERFGTSAPYAAIDATACRRYAQAAQANLDKRIAKEQLGRAQ
ncbi:MAG: subclass B3 metallo-beta-lactamase [Dokdonella sp.]